MAVSGMMIGTTVLATLAMFTVWEASVFVAIPFLLIFGALLIPPCNIAVEHLRCLGSNLSHQSGSGCTCTCLNVSVLSVKEFGVRCSVAAWLPQALLMACTSPPTSTRSPPVRPLRSQPPYD